MEYVWLLAGFVLLVIGADIFVEGSSAIAKLFKILVFAKTKKRFSRPEGAVMLGIYVVYFAYILVR